MIERWLLLAETIKGELHPVWMYATFVRAQQKVNLAAKIRRVVRADC